jgi:hypothetical protein
VRFHHANLLERNLKWGPNPLASGTWISIKGPSRSVKSQNAHLQMNLSENSISSWPNGEMPVVNAQRDSNLVSVQTNSPLSRIGTRGQRADRERMARPPVIRCLPERGLVVSFTASSPSPAHGCSSPMKGKGQKRRARPFDMNPPASTIDEPGRAVRDGGMDELNVVHPFR